MRAGAALNGFEAAGHLRTGEHWQEGVVRNGRDHDVDDVMPSAGPIRQRLDEGGAWAANQRQADDARIEKRPRHRVIVVQQRV